MATSFFPVSSSFSSTTATQIPLVPFGKHICDTLITGTYSGYLHRYVYLPSLHLICGITGPAAANEREVGDLLIKCQQ